MNQITSSKSPPVALGPMHWLRSEIDRLFDDFGGSRALFDFGPKAFDFAVNPALEFKEGEKDYQLTAELPGMSDKDVAIDVADEILTISGEKKEGIERKDDGRILSERRYGSFRRQLAVPSDADPAKIRAQFVNGVLTITMPKDEKAGARSRKIAIGT